MDYGDVINDLRKSNDYFNRILYRDILPLKTKLFLKKENTEMLIYYYIRRRNKILYILIQNIYLRKIIYNFKINKKSNKYISIINI